MSKEFLQKLRMAASETDDLLTSCDASDLLDGLEVARDFMFEASCVIEKLESQLAQVERERDAAVHDLKLADRVDCDFCKHQYGGCTFDGCQDCSKPCPCGSCRNASNYEWRGVCAENTEEETK